MSKIFLIFNLFAFIGIIIGLPDGAPECYLEPGHGTSSQPLNTIPYQVIANSSVYAPGSIIELRITGTAPFKGFVFQARDSQTDEPIGEWQAVSNSRPSSKCHSVTHTDPADKNSISLLWESPINKYGNVYFTGAIVMNYSTYWSNLVSQVANQ